MVSGVGWRAGSSTVRDTVTGGVRVERVRSRAAMEQFARLPFEVYRDYDAWWPPDVENEIAMVSGRTILSSYVEILPLCAYRNDVPVARISAAINERYNRHWGEKLGLLLHFEALPREVQAVGALFAEALSWLKSRGMEAARSGFASFLDYPYAIDNYGNLPPFLLRGNPSYYHCYFKNAGFETEKGQTDYTAPLTPELLEGCRKAAVLRHDPAVEVRTWREYGFLAAVDVWTNVTNAAFAHHWGWNPVSHAEVRPMMASLGNTEVGDLSMLALAGDRPVGTTFSVPDLSSRLALFRSEAAVRSRQDDIGVRGALISIGVLEDFRRRGVGLVMAARSFLAMAERGLRYAGYTLVLDDNWPSRRTAERLGARVTSNFVTYRRAL